MNKKIAGAVKVWSIIVGVLSLSTLLTLSIYGVASLEGVLALIGLILGLAVVYVGVRAAALVAGTVSGVLWAKLAVLVIDFLLALSARHTSFFTLIVVVVEGVIVGYLLSSVKKLHHS